MKDDLPSLLIRNVDETLHRRLKARAAAHRRSLEEEARELLRAGIARQEPHGEREHIVDVAKRLFGPTNGFDFEIPPRGSAPSRIPPDYSDEK